MPARDAQRPLVMREPVDGVGTFDERAAMADVPDITGPGPFASSSRAC